MSVMIAWPLAMENMRVSGRKADGEGEGEGGVRGFGRWEQVMPPRLHHQWAAKLTPGGTQAAQLGRHHSQTLAGSLMLMGGAQPRSDRICWRRAGRQAAGQAA